jgi:hypothetical protein
VKDQPAFSTRCQIEHSQRSGDLSCDRLLAVDVRAGRHCLCEDIGIVVWRDRDQHRVDGGIQQPSWRIASAVGAGTVDWRHPLFRQNFIELLVRRLHLVREQVGRCDDLRVGVANHL